MIDDQLNSDDLEQQINFIYNQYVNRYGNISNSLELNAIRRHWLFLVQLLILLKNQVSLGLISRNKSIRELTNIIFNIEKPSSKPSLTNVFTENFLYPLTITKDRYGGTYSGGEYIAFNCEPFQVPKEALGGDCDAAEFFIQSFPNPKGLMIGIGNTPELACEDLLNKLNLQKYKALE